MEQNEPENEVTVVNLENLNLMLGYTAGLSGVQLDCPAILKHTVYLHHQTVPEDHCYSHSLAPFKITSEPGKI